MRTKQVGFTNHGADSDERIEWSLYAFLSRFPEDLPNISRARKLSEEECASGPNGPVGIRIITHPTEMERVASSMSLGAVEGAVVLIIARWAYHWCGNENDYATLETCDNVVSWLEGLPEGVVIAGEAEADVD